MSTVSERGYSYALYIYDDTDSETLAIPFPYLSTTHVFVLVGDSRKFAGIDYTINATTGVLSWETGKKPTNGAVVKVFRRTPFLQLVRIWSDPATLAGADLNAGFRQVIYVLQELADASGGVLEWNGPGTGPGGTPDIYIPDPTDPDTDLPPGLTKADFDIYWNGLHLHPDDYNLVNTDNATQLTFNVTFEVGDTLYVRLRRGTAVASLDPDSVGEGALKDGSVTEPKLADDAIRWRALAFDNVSDPDWSALIDSSPVADLMLDLNARLAALEGGGAGSRLESITVSASADASAQFSFTPDYVLVIHGSPNVGTGNILEQNSGPTFVVEQGASGAGYRHDFGNDGDGVDLIIEATLSGDTLDITNTSTQTAGQLTLIAVKE